MSFENGLSVADMAAVMKDNDNGWGGNGSGWWIILFFILCLGGGWGNGGFGGGGVNADLQRGFDQQATTSQISSLQSQVGNGFADAAVATCQGNASITQAITNGQYATAQAITSAKDTVATGMNQLGLSILQGNCDNKAGLADLKYTVATENCADRQTISDGIRDLMASGVQNTQTILNGINEQIRAQQQGTQSILDKMCAMELDAARRENENLRTQLNMANLAASQTEQTAKIVSQLRPPTPIPAFTVPNPFAPTTTAAG